MRGKYGKIGRAHPEEKTGRDWSGKCRPSKAIFKISYMNL